MLFHGNEPRGSEHPETVDALLSDAITRSGRAGVLKEATFCWVARDMALEACRDRDPAGLSVAVPAPGSVVTFVPGCGDLVYKFGRWLRDRANYGSSRLLHDVAGDVRIVDAYLSRKLQRKRFSEIADFFVKSLTIEEFVVGEDGSLDRIGSHEGEVYVTGPCELVPAPAAPTP